MYDHIVEVGCTGRLSLHEFVKNASRVQVIEPVPRHVEIIKSIYKDFRQLVVHPVAIWDKSEKIKMYELGETSYVDGVASPVVSNFNYKGSSEHELIVDATTFDAFDDGTIDIIDIDTEGSEWHVIKNMISRPKVIILETSWNNYINPYMQEIERWMSDNRYAAVAQDKANTFYKLFGR